MRGLDYYTRTAFEFTHGALGAQNAILGGGRYDGLSESLGGPPAPGIGFAIGEDRLVMTLQEAGIRVVAPVDVYIAPIIEGGSHDFTPARGLGVATIAEAFRLQDVTVSRVENDVRIQGRVRPPQRPGGLDSAEP